MSHSMEVSGPEFVPLVTDGGGYSWSKYMRTSLHALFLGSKFNVMLPFVALAILFSSLGGPSSAIFCCSVLGLAPLAERLGFITEELAKCTNAMVGGLLNATFSNAPELIIVIVALKARMFRMVQLSLMGSIIGNLLLCLGSAFLAGGIAYKTLHFNKIAAQSYSSMILLGFSGVVFPTFLTFSGTSKEGSRLFLSRIISILMLVAYSAYIYFQLGTHYDVFDGDGNNESEIRESSIDGEDQESSAAEDDDEEKVLGLWGSLFWLALVTTLISMLSDYLVDTVQEAAEELGIPAAGLVVVVLPLVNNVAEHSSAIIFGYRNKLDVALAIALGSSIQLMMFLIPFAVIAGWMIGEHMDLNLPFFELCMFGSAVFLSISSLQGANANWLKGLTLIVAYLMIASTFCANKGSIVTGGNTNSTLNH